MSIDWERYFVGILNPQQTPAKAACLTLVAVVLLCALPWHALAQQSPRSPLGQRILQRQQQLRDQIGSDRDQRGGAGVDQGTRGGAQEAPERRPAVRPRGGVTANVQVIGGEGGASVRAIGGEGPFEPFKRNPIIYGALPPLDDEILLTLEGPRPAAAFLADIVAATNWNMLVSPAVQPLQLMFWLTDVAPEQAMEVLKFHDIYYQWDPETNFISVMTKDEFLQKEYGEMVEEEFIVSHANLADVESTFSTLLSPQGRMLVDARTLRIHVQDTADNIAYMRRTVDSIDVPLESLTYDLSNLDVEGVVDSIEALLSENGQMWVDPRTNTLVVRDHPDRQVLIAQLVGDFDVPLETRSWILNYADPVEIADQVALLVPEQMGMISVNETLHQITITAIPERLEQIDNLIMMWDKKRRQVQIEAYLLTASRNISRQLGVNWSYFTEIGDQPFGFQFGTLDRSPGAPGSDQRVVIGQLPEPQIQRRLGVGPVEDLLGNNIVTGFSGTEISAVLDVLETEGDVTILAHPRVTVQDGEEAVFENTTQVPFSQSTADTPVSNIDPGTGQFVSSFRSVSRIEFIDVGTILRVTPRISDAGTILMELSAEDSSFEIVQVTGGGEENDVPQKTQNRAETQVLVHDGSTLVIGGLRTSSVTDNISKIPLLGDIPLLGRIFRSTDKDHGHRDLMIFLTPTIIDEFTQPEATRLAAADLDLADTLRYDQKEAFGRIGEWASHNQNEIIIAIGQAGEIFADQEILTFDQLRRLFFEEKSEKTVRVVIRKHPRAPDAILTQVQELALEAGLEIHVDRTSAPFVPSLQRPPDSSITDIQWRRH